MASQGGNHSTVLLRCGKCRRDGRKPPLLGAVVISEGGDAEVCYTPRTPSTINFGGWRQPAAETVGQRTQPAPVRTRTAHFECRGCQAKPRKRRAKLVQEASAELDRTSTDPTYRTVDGEPRRQEIVYVEG